MQTENRLIDDLAKVAASTVGVLAGVKDEVEARLRQQFERVLDGMELVNRDEFETVRAMAAEARAENERLARRLAALEKAVAAGQARPKPEAKKQKAAKATKKGPRGG